MQLSPSRHQEGVGGIGVLHMESDIPLCFQIEAFPQFPGSDVFSFPPGKGLVFTPKVTRSVGSSTWIGGRGWGCSKAVMVSPMPTSPGRSRR